MSGNLDVVTVVQRRQKQKVTGGQVWGGRERREMRWPAGQLVAGCNCSGGWQG